MRGRLEAKGYLYIYKGSYLREAGGTGVKQEWWIALCLVACVGQTPVKYIDTGLLCESNYI